MKNYFIGTVALLVLLLAGGTGVFGQSAGAPEQPPQEKPAPESPQPPDTLQAEQEKSESKSDDKKSDDKQSNDKQSDDKQSDDKKADDKKSDEQQSDDKKSDGKKSEKQSENDESETPQSDDPSDEDSGNEQSDELTNRSDVTRSIFGGNSDAEEAYSKRSENFVAVFKPVIASVATSTVRIMSGRRQLALGIVVDSNGLILTKASELKDDLSCLLPDGRAAKAEVFGIHPETDLALLKIELDNLTPIQWSTDPTPVVGQWLATPNGQKTILDVGIVGVNARVIPPSSPFIGIGPPRIPGDEIGARIDSVVPGSPADDADLLVADIITHIDDVEIKDWDGLRKTLEQYDANDRITLTVLRAGKDIKIKLTLAERDKISPQNLRSNQQNSMGSTLSRRRKDFPSAFQHDSMLTSSTCGGPVVNLDGQVVGVNIARAGRVDSLALPVETVLPVVALLETGELAPAIVNKVRLAEIDTELADISTKLEQLPSKKSALETQYQVEKAKQEELERILKDVQDRLKVIELKTQNFGTELETVKDELQSIEKIRQRLEADRQQLATGLR